VNKQDWKPRFLEKVGSPDLDHFGCMEWLGAVDTKSGYGRFGLNREPPQVRMAHRPRGHEYTEENTRRKKSNGTRQCRACDSYYNSRRVR
jgi:hypothetical protein